MSLVDLVVLRRHHAVRPKFTLMHPMLMPRQMEQLLKQDPLFSSFFVLLFGYFLLFPFEDKMIVIFGGVRPTFCVNINVLYFVHIFGSLYLKFCFILLFVDV